MTDEQQAVLQVLCVLAVIGAAWLLWALCWVLGKVSRWLCGEGGTTEDELSAKREALRVAWEALEQARRVNEVYFLAGQDLHQASRVQSGRRSRRC